MSFLGERLILRLYKLIVYLQLNSSLVLENRIAEPGSFKADS